MHRSAPVDDLGQKSTTHRSVGTPLQRPRLANPFRPPSAPLPSRLPGVCLLPPWRTSDQQEHESFRGMAPRAAAAALLLALALALGSAVGCANMRAAPRRELMRQRQRPRPPPAAAAGPMQPGAQIAAAGTHSLRTRRTLKPRVRKLWDTNYGYLHCICTPLTQILTAQMPRCPPPDRPRSRTPPQYRCKVFEGRERMRSFAGARTTSCLHASALDATASRARW